MGFNIELSAFILSAGLGERLRPITNHIPKPLIPVLGKPVLESVLEKVSALPVDTIGINLHHKKIMIENWIKQSAFSNRAKLFPENPILGTGGALKNAESILKNSIFLVHNSDVISDIDLKKLLDYHLSSKNIATLAVHDYPEFNRLILDKNGLLKDIVKHPHPYPPPSRGREVEEIPSPSRGKESSGIPPSSGNSLPLKIPPSPGGRGLDGGGYEILAFTGIAVYQPEFLKFLPGGNSSVVDAWFNAISAGHKIGTMDVSGCYWSDIGTPASYAKAVIHKLRKNGESVYINPSVTGCNRIEMDGYVVIEKKSSLNKGLSLRNCIILPETNTESENQNDTECILTIFWGRGSHISTPPSPPFTKEGLGGVLFENCIIGPDFKIDLDESEIFSVTEGNAILIGTGGSDRKYYRVKRENNPAVLMQCLQDDPDFYRHIEYTRFFQQHSVPVPELLEVKPDNKSALFEDLGDLSLYSWLKCPREQVQIENVYRKAIDILISFHTGVAEHISVCPLLQSRIFDYEYLRWETNYFIERFVEGCRNISLKNLSSLIDEFHRLAVKVDSFPKTIIHRDFQSQNIMITKGGIPRVLDYQGARIGPSTYDVVSLLWDPYYRLNDNTRERLLDYYINKMSENARWFSVKNFGETILPCRLQRHMQALGAYGFLSVVKGKKYFLKHIPEGLRLLREDMSIAKNEYPVLDDLVKKL